jgi:hypothetical protein
MRLSTAINIFDTTWQQFLDGPKTQSHMVKLLLLKQKGYIFNLGNVLTEIM